MMSKVSLDVPLKKLKCAACSKQLSNPPVYVRITGESVCATCCFADGVAPIRNKLYEEIMKGALFPCEFAEKGCPARVGFNNAASHVLNCKYQYYKCPLEPCVWRGEVDSIIEHLTTIHRAVKAENTKVFFRRSAEVCKLLNVEGRNFLLWIEERKQKICIEMINLDIGKEVEYKFSIYKPNAKEDAEIRKKAKTRRLNGSQYVVEIDNNVIDNLLGPSELLECSFFADKFCANA